MDNSTNENFSIQVDQVAHEEKNEESYEATNKRNTESNIGIRNELLNTEIIDEIDIKGLVIEEEVEDRGISLNSDGSSPPIHPSPTKTKIGHQFQIMKEKLNLSFDSPLLRCRSLETSSSMNDTKNSFDEGSEFDYTFEETQKSPENVFEQFYKHYRNAEIQRELKLVQENQQDGVYLTPSIKSSQIWFGVMFIRDGPYKEGIFHFTMYFKDDFPESRPIMRFKSRVFHPQVDRKKGIINLQPAYVNVINEKIHVWDLLKYARSCFYHLNINNAVNLQAAYIFRTDINVYMSRCRTCVLKSLLEFEEQRHVKDHENENPFRCHLLEDNMTYGVKKAIMENQLPANKNSGMFEWARHQLGKVINNINYMAYVQGSSEDTLLKNNRPNDV